MVLDSGADFIKTSTGFGSEGAKVRDITLLKRVIGRQKLGIKAAGGIQTYGDAVAMMQAGATRIGTSRGVEIMQETISSLSS